MLYDAQGEHVRTTVWYVVVCRRGVLTRCIFWGKSQSRGRRQGMVVSATHAPG